MIEEKILNAVSEVTGISVDTLKSSERVLDISKARMMYYYLCHEKGLLYEPIGLAVNKSANLVGLGIASFSLFLRNNGKYRELLKEAKELMDGLNTKDEIEWRKFNDCEYIYIKDIKYSLLDVSSRYFGSGYIGMINDEYVLFEEEREAVRKKLMLIAKNGIQEDNN